MVKEASEAQVIINIFPAFGPQIDPIRLKASPSDTLGSVRRTLSHIFKVGFHDRIILTRRGKELGFSDDDKALNRLGITHGDSLTMSLYTPPLPLKSKSFHKADEVEIQGVALEKCLSHAKKHVHAEVGGLLIGRDIGGEKTLIVDAQPISEGNQTSVVLNPRKIAHFVEGLRGGENYVVGWYHSHVKSGESMSSIDARLQSGYQRLYPNTVALVLDPVKETAGFYRVKEIPRFQVEKRVYLNMRELKPMIMDSDALSLTTIIQEREEAEITAFSGSDTYPGESSTFKVSVKNTGTIPFSNVKVNLSLFSPDRRESFLIYSDEINLSPGDSGTYTLQCKIPDSWPSGEATVTVGVRNMSTHERLCRLAKASIRLLQVPVYDVKISAYRTSQRISPGQTATYIVMVKNNGNRRDEIEINWEDSQMPEGWTAKIYDGEIERVPPFNITLDAGATHKFILRVASPTGGYGGEQARIMLKGRSLSSTSRESEEASS